MSLEAPALNPELEAPNSNFQILNSKPFGPLDFGHLILFEI
jgi:hypothetical protein